MSRIRIGAPAPFRRWYTDRKAERQALTEYKVALRALTRLHRHRDRAVGGRRSSAIHHPLMPVVTTTFEEYDMPRYLIDRELPGAGSLSDGHIQAISKKSDEVLAAENRDGVR